MWSMAMQGAGVSGLELLPPSLQPKERITGVQIAKLLDRFISAVWLGEPVDADEFFRWLGSTWVASNQLPPAGVPEAISVLAAGGRGVWWYAQSDLLLGYIPHREDGYYRVSRTAEIPGMGVANQLSPAS